MRVISYYLSHYRNKKGYYLLLITNNLSYFYSAINNKFSEFSIRIVIYIKTSMVRK